MYNGNNKGVKMEKVSVIMPAYNCEKFLKHAVHSVQAQTYSDWELIIIDDASRDDTFVEAQKLAATDERIKVYSLEQNKGVSFCRNFAIAQAQGRYLAFLDSDDLWSKDKLTRQIAFMQSKNVALSHTSYAFMNEKGFVMKNGKVNVDEEVDLQKYMKTTQIGMSSVIIDRNQIGKVQFPEDRQLCEDARVWMAYLRQGKKFCGLNEVLTLYRVRGSQLSGNKMKMAENTLKRYWHEKNLPAYKRLYYFLNYACNGIQKRLRSTQPDVKDISSRFNCNKR